MMVRHMCASKELRDSESFADALDAGVTREMQADDRNKMHPRYRVTSCCIHRTRMEFIGAFSAV